MTRNITITVPDGTSDHGNPSLICFPPHWYDYVLFFVGNYFAHAATVIPEPGMSLPRKIFSTTLAVLFPLFGLDRPLDIFLTRPILAKTPLDRAARAWALCMVMKVADAKRLERVESGDWDPEDIELLSSNSLPIKWWRGNLQTWKIPKRDSIHGSVQLPTGYSVYRVPPSTPLRPWSGKATASPAPAGRVHPPEIASSYSAARIIVSLCQLAWALTTLYRARGDQIDRYGYAAFGFTALPYAWMSFINLMGNLLSPTYETLYLISTPALDELQAAGTGAVDGIVGELDEQAIIARARANKHVLAQPASIRVHRLLWWFLGLVPVAILGGLTRFSIGESAAAERSWITAWLIVGVTVPFLTQTYDFTSTPVGPAVQFIVMTLYLLQLGSLASVIGGFVMVGKMLGEFGMCTLIRAS